MHYHLAQVNVAQMRATPYSPTMAGLVVRIDEMNRAAENSKGFVWRLPGSEVSRAALGVFDGYFVPFDPARLFYNLSLWDSVEDLRHYVFSTIHVEMLHRKHEWIQSMDRPHLALWWIPAGERPSIAESAQRLRSLDEHGPTPIAFTFERRFAKPFK